MGYVIKHNKIELVRGDTLRAHVDILCDGEAYELREGDSLRFALKKSYNSKTVIINKVIPAETLMLTLDPEDTAGLDGGVYVYDIELTFANGDIDTFIRDELHLLPDVV